MVGISWLSNVSFFYDLINIFRDFGEVRVKIADHYSRAPQGGVGYAKAAGNYGGQFYPTQLANAEGFQQII